MILLYWSSFVFIIVKLRNCVNCRFHVVPCVVYISVVILCTVLATFQPKVVVACYSLNHYYYKPKQSQHSFTMAKEEVLNNFIRHLLITNSSEWISRDNKGQASMAYSSTGRHFVLVKWRITSSEANLPTLPKMALKLQKSFFLQASRRQRNRLPLTITIPKYLKLVTHCRTLPDNETILLHGESFR